MARPRLFAGSILLFLLACQTPAMYRWGGYDQALYDHYKAPQERDVFVAHLKEVIDGAEGANSKVPPGCYAEYGYALYEEGRYKDAQQYFQKEREAWPESRGFMDRMIANAAHAAATPAGGNKAPAASQGAAPALEGR